MSEPLIVVLAVAGFLIVFPLFWMAITWLVSTVGGWSVLAEQYPASEPLTGETFSWRSVRLGFFGSYSNCMRVTISGRGLYLQPLFVYRFGHRPVFIPWEAVAAMHINLFGIFSAADLSISGKDGAAPIKLKLYGRALVEAIEKHGVKG
ncbi:MAG: hypothetical protein AAF441_16595 [Pseudomonadota bacterium]